MSNVAKRLFRTLVAVLLAAQLLLVLLSWLLSATMTTGVRSLLSSEGVRWFVGSFADVLATPALVWLLLLAMSGGCLWQSGLLSRAPGYRDSVALRSAVVLLLLYVAVFLGLTVVPHAVLLSATGQLLPSPFSRAIVPVVSFGVLLVSAVYGWLSGRFATFSAVADSLSFGVAKAAPAFVLYVLVVQLFASLHYVF